MSTDDDLRAYSVKEAAKRLSLSEVQVRREVKAGRLAARRSGGKGFRVLIPASALRAYLDGEPLPQKGKAATVPPPV